MADKRTEIADSIETIRKAVYGKDVREAIASGIELCYDYVGGQAALDAAVKAQEAVDRLQTVVDNSEGALNDLNEAIENVGELVTISQTQPTNPENKIWIKPQADQEYKVATFDAYAELWNHVDDMTETYEKGHGGIKSVTLDQEYADEEEEDLLFEDRLKKRYVITFSDGYTSDFYVSNGAVGKIGPPDPIVDMRIEYVKGETNASGQLVKVPPASGWTATIPDLGPGDWLWTRTNNIFESGGVSYIYAVSRQGNDGQGSMNSVRLGTSGTPMTNDVTLPVDATPIENGTGLLLSGSIYNAINAAVAAVKVNTALTGTPTAPTAAAGTNTEQIATTAFVDAAVKNTQINTTQLFASPAFTGTPTAPTADAGTNDTQVATTEFVQTAAEAAILGALQDIHSFSLQKTTNSKSQFVIGITPMSRHFVIFNHSNLSNSAVVLLTCWSTGKVQVLSLAKGNNVTFEANYSSTNDCGLRVTLNAADVTVNIMDFVYFQGTKVSTWQDASLKSSLAEAQAFL